MKLSKRLMTEIITSLLDPASDVTVGRNRIIINGTVKCSTNEIVVDTDQRNYHEYGIVEFPIPFGYRRKYERALTWRIEYETLKAMKKEKQHDTN